MTRSAVITSHPLLLLVILYNLAHFSLINFQPQKLTENSSLPLFYSPFLLFPLTDSVISPIEKYDIFCNFLKDTITSLYPEYNPVTITPPSKSAKRSNQTIESNLSHSLVRLPPGANSALKPLNSEGRPSACSEEILPASTTLI